jgi:hypothetical protein
LEDNKNIKKKICKKKFQIKKIGPKINFFLILKARNDADPRKLLNK